MIYLISMDHCDPDPIHHYGLIMQLLDFNYYHLIN